MFDYLMVELERTVYTFLWLFFPMSLFCNFLSAPFPFLSFFFVRHLFQQLEFLSNPILNNLRHGHPTQLQSV